MKKKFFFLTIYKLLIEEDISICKVKLNQPIWSHYENYKGYELLSLHRLKAYIRQLQQLLKKIIK